MIYIPDLYNSQASRKSLKSSYWLKLNVLSMSKPKVPSNIISAKLSNISEICVTYRISKKQENC